MKHIIAYIFVLLVGFNSCGLDQLLKVPRLFSHYHEHLAGGTIGDIADFISMHYLGMDINDDDSERDMQLPFKSIDVHSLSIYIFSPYAIPEFCSNRLPFVRHNTFYLEMYCGSFSPAQLRPPRYA